MMNRSLFPHIIWILVASISFIVGYKFFPAGDDRSAGPAAMDQGNLSLDQAELQLDQQKEVRKGEEFQDRLQSQEKQTFARIDAAAEREKMRNAQQRG